MAGSFNKVLLMGNLTRDVELRHTQSNQAVAKPRDRRQPALPHRRRREPRRR